MDEQHVRAALRRAGRDGENEGRWERGTVGARDGGSEGGRELVMAAQSRRRGYSASPVTCLLDTVSRASRSARKGRGDLPGPLNRPDGTTQGVRMTGIHRETYTTMVRSLEVGWFVDAIASGLWAALRSGGMGESSASSASTASERTGSSLP